MRLDKMITSTGIATRSQVTRAARAGQITLNGKAVRHADTQVDPDNDLVFFAGQPVIYRRYTYIMLNKPDGYVSATTDDRFPVVTALLPQELQNIGLFPCGRLDKNTLGLMLLTNNGELAHKLLLPRMHVAKTYAFACKFPLNADDLAQLENGVDIGGYITKPCSVHSASDLRSGQITITEGKYHQIKLMFEAVHNQITALERLSFGNLTLDPTLERGKWRYLTESEVEGLKACINAIKP